MAQERLNAFAVIFIEVKGARKLEIDKMIDIFAEKLQQFNWNNLVACNLIFSHIFSGVLIYCYEL